MKRLLLCGLLAACGSTAKTEPVTTAPLAIPTTSASPVAAPTAPEGSLASRESKLVAKTLARVSELRGIKAKKPVPGVKLERTALVGRIRDKALREYPAEALRRETQLIQLFGFAPPTFDYLGELTKLLEAQLEGFYEPNNGTMYLAQDLEGGEAEAALAHELVHALQDQNYDLKSRSTYRPGKGDETMALSCLAEGDATSLMIDYMLAKGGQQGSAVDLPPALLKEVMAGSTANEKVMDVPHILRTSLVAPYAEGLTFVHALRRGGGWSRVDEAWKRVPVSTEQVLHPEKWEKNEAPVVLAPPPAATLGADWKREDEDTLGELGLALQYEEWMTSTDARSAANGWGGDRSALWAKGDEIAYAVHLRQDEASVTTGKSARKDEHARNAFTKLAAGAKRKVEGKVAYETADGLCIERPALGPLAIARKDRDLVIIAGPASVKDGTWKSTSTCATAKTWASEVLRP